MNLNRNRAGITALFTLALAAPCAAQKPTISPNGVVPLYSTSTTIQAGEWISIYGTNLASGTTAWTGNFPLELGGTSVSIDGKAAYLWFVSSGQINCQVPNDTAIGTVQVSVSTSTGSAVSSVTMASVAPSLLLLDSKHIYGIIIRSNGSGAYGGGTYDIIGPTGTSLGYSTVAARPGDSVVLFGVGFGPTSPAVAAGQAYSGAAATTNPVQILINNVSVTPSFAGLSSAGLYQFNLTIPAGAGTGDVSLSASVGGVQTQPGVVISVQAAAVSPQVQALTLSSGSVAGGAAVTGTVTLSAAAPAGGAVVSLSSSSTAASVPASVTVAAGSTTATFTVTGGTVSASQTATITAALSFSSVVIYGATWTVSGFPNIGLIFGIQPNNGTSTFTVTGTPSFVGCTASNGNATFSCSSLAPGLQGIVLPPSLTIVVSSASLSLTLNAPAPSANFGTVSGTLTVTGAPPGGSVQTYTGPLSGGTVIISP